MRDPLISWPPLTRGTLIRRYVSRQDGAQWLVIEVRCHTPDAVTLFHTVVASIHWLDPALAAT